MADRNHAGHEARPWTLTDLGWAEYAMGARLVPVVGLPQISDHDWQRRAATAANLAHFLNDVAADPLIGQRGAPGAH